ncbi:CBO0543 family protein [Paenibacillus mucilaginosus]|uniref:Uncharacterized protein n=1 Tax=Paenibacillus mucilaginosus (strain KNP414) TaxID=1036673 RepID=F8FGJ7_PAEMK|nr:CBO0543 family protein [Paenibacillus mucilaginosus]AEI44657.1 hypothetical protein KNP414_06133 [Paenibacillus mucilaginosus KNP414]MCG7215587.1 hypothetical protein [Paenibacillus mucilaginosus]WDM26216.1 hypothetical protein KCX80_27820 [Paenibacillus mucilaginosus]
MMTSEQQEILTELSNRASSLTNDWSMYWKTYSHPGTWQFWAYLLTFAVPLVALVIRIDRKLAFRLGFYGLTVHLLSTYVDTYATTHRMWQYPYRIIPAIPFSVGLDVSLIPVVYMLFYQWTLKRRKNYYLWLLVVSAAFTYGLKPLLVLVGLFRFYEGTYFQLFLLYFGGGLVAKWLTDLFKYAQSRSLDRADNSA